MQGKIKVASLYKILLIVLVLFVCLSFAKQSEVANRISSMESQLRSIQLQTASIDNNMNHIEANVKDTLKRTSSLISEFDYEFGDCVDKKQDVNFSVTPKEHRKGEKVYFRCELFPMRKESENEKIEPQMIEATSEDGVNFTATMFVPIEKSLSVSLVLDDGMVKRMESLEQFPAYIEKLADRFDAGVEWNRMQTDTTNVALISYSVHADIHYDKEQTMGHLSAMPWMEILVDGKKVKTAKLKPEKEEEIGSSFDGYYQGEISDCPLNGETEQVVEIYVKAKSKEGFLYQNLVDAFSYSTQEGRKEGYEIGLEEELRETVIIE